MSNRFLSLSMSELRPGKDEFNVLAMNIPNGELLNVQIEKSRIKNSAGEVFWDLGKITEVQNAESDFDKNGNNSIKVSGEMMLRSEEVSLKDVLEDNLTSYFDFSNDRRKTICICRASKINGINTMVTESNVVKSYLDIDFGKGIQRILDKDYRWVSYWSYKIKQGEFECAADERRYTKLLNNPNKNLYLIMYRRYFRNGKYLNPYTWIAGMHWL